MPVVLGAFRLKALKGRCEFLENRQVPHPLLSLDAVTAWWRPRLIDRPQWSSSRGGVMLPAAGVAKSNGGT